MVVFPALPLQQDVRLARIILCFLIWLSRITSADCDPCRARKVRCDKGSPCSNCRSSGSACRTSRKEETEPKSRVMITKEYENKIDRIGDRLAIIEGYLKRIPVPEHPVSVSRAATLLQRPADALVSVAESSIVHTNPSSYTETYDATTNTHSTLASKVVERAVEESPMAHRNPALASALNSLRDMLGRINDDPKTSEMTTRYWTIRPADYSTSPPSHKEIYSILTGADDSLTLSLFPLSSVASLKEKSELVFNHPEDCSPVRRVLVYSVLFNLCMEYSGHDVDGNSSKRYSALAKWFLGGLEGAIADLRLTMPPTPEAVEALIIAASSAVELCRPYLALSLTSAAASMVVSLGYHRSTSVEFDTAQERDRKIFVFWMVYVFDSSFSVRLGRAPVIQDDDITIPMITHGGTIPVSSIESFCYWIEIVKVQCQAVEHLYSPTALRRPLEERSNRAAKLAERLEEAWKARNRVPSPEGPHASSYCLFKESDSIMHYSTIALLQHATMSSRTNDSPALDTARHALKLTIEARKTHKGLPDYIWSAHCHWTLFHAPFTPFTVTFCHIVANPTNGNDDLRLLAEFVATLRSLDYLSEGVAKLYRLCDIFQKVAELYTQAKIQEANRDNQQRDKSSVPVTESIQPAINDIDGYLSTIGFAPPSPNTFSGATVDDAQLDADYLSNWFHGNNSLMGLLEQDLAYTGWPDTASAHYQ